MMVLKIKQLRLLMIMQVEIAEFRLFTKKIGKYRKPYQEGLKSQKVNFVLGQVPIILFHITF